MALTYDEFKTIEARYEAGEATELDLVALEPYRARRAVLLASGFGSRMMPITINTPKPLVDVNGMRIIETLLSALIAIDVEEIYIVTGYKAECFETLYRDYPTVTLLNNPFTLLPTISLRHVWPRIIFAMPMCSRAICF